MSQAAAEFDSMNAARINAFLQSMNVSVAQAVSSSPLEGKATSLEVPAETALSALLRSQHASVTERGMARRWYIHAVFVSCASFAVLYSVLHRFRLRSKQYKSLCV